MDISSDTVYTADRCQNTPTDIRQPYQVSPLPPRASSNFSGIFAQNSRGGTPATEHPEGQGGVACRSSLAIRPRSPEWLSLEDRPWRIFLNALPHSFAE